jgi:hypothetical protein
MAQFATRKDTDTLKRGTKFPAGGIPPAEMTNQQAADHAKVDRGEHLRRRKDLYEAMHPETGHGGLPGKAGGGKETERRQIVVFRKRHSFQARHRRAHREIYFNTRCARRGVD